MQEQGKIKWFNPIKGYGFITPNNGGGDVLLHVSVCQLCHYDPQTGATVLYKSYAAQTGQRATWVGKAP